MVVWRLGDALLAVALGAVDEVVGVGADGRARARGGALELHAPPGLDLPAGSRQAVIIASGAGEGVGAGSPPQRLALAADEVEGVYEAGDVSPLPPPGWLGRLDAPHLTGLIRLQDGRVAAALDPDALSRAP
jgi:chemotaxis signal transduction protein